MFSSYARNTTQLTIWMLFVAFCALVSLLSEDINSEVDARPLEATLPPCHEDTWYDWDEMEDMPFYRGPDTPYETQWVTENGVCMSTYYPR